MENMWRLIRLVEPTRLVARWVEVTPWLTPREKEILKLRYLRKKSYVEVGKRLGISRERVRQIEQRALEILFHEFDEELTPVVSQVKCLLEKYDTLVTQPVKKIDPRRK